MEADKEGRRGEWCCGMKQKRWEKYPYESGKGREGWPGLAESGQGLTGLGEEKWKQTSKGREWKGSGRGMADGGWRWRRARWN
jgi:hypothetical protein